MAAITLTTENFEQEVMNSEVPILIDFWASWCGPCTMMSPVIKEIEEESSKETLKVGTVNIDEQGELASQYGVMSIPTFLVVKKGAEMGRSVGVQDKQDLLDMIQKASK